MENVKFCKDCKHYKSSKYTPVYWSGGFYYPETCSSPDRPITPQFYVNGLSTLAEPIDARKPGGFCKPEAIHWAESPPQPEPPVLMSCEEYNAQFGVLEEQHVPPNPWWKFWKQEG